MSKIRVVRVAFADPIKISFVVKYKMFVFCHFPFPPHGPPPPPPLVPPGRRGPGGEEQKGTSDFVASVDVVVVATFAVVAVVAAVAVVAVVATVARLNRQQQPQQQRCLDRVSLVFMSTSSKRFWALGAKKPKITDLAAPLAFRRPFVSLTYPSSNSLMIQSKPKGMLF